MGVEFSGFNMEAVMKEAAKGGQRIFEQRIAGMTCPTHGGAATIETDMEGGKLEGWKVFACCEEFRADVLEALKDK